MNLNFRSTRKNQSIKENENTKKDVGKSVKNSSYKLSINPIFIVNFES
jgi:hypothetical protein